MNALIRILYVDDSPLDRDLVLDSLEKEHGGFQVTHAASRADFELALTEERFDLILSDFNIHGFEGLQVLETVHAKDPDLPVIIVTGTGSEEIAVEAMKRGAADYVIKTPKHIQRLPFTIDTVLEKKHLEDERRQSEVRYRLIFENSGEGILLTDPTGTIYSANPEACRIFQRDESELKSLGRHGVIDINDPRLPEALEERKRTGHYKGELNLVRKDGTIFPADVSATVFRDLLGNERTSMTIRDITKRKQAEQKITQQLNRITALREIDQTITSDFNLSHSLKMLIERAVALLNVDASAVLLLQPETNLLTYGAGFGFRTTAPETASVNLGESYAGKAAMERRLVQIPNLAHEPDNLFLTGFLKGEDFVSYYGTPLIVKDEVVGVLEVFNRILIERDHDWLDFFITLAGQAAIAIANAQLFSRMQRELTERLRAEEEIRNLNLKLEQRVAERTVELERALRVKDEFLANMSHELRTPLNAILGLSESLVDGIGGELSEKQSKYIHTINESGQHLLNLINDILDLAKIEAGQVSLESAKVNLHTVCQASLRMIQQLAKKKKQEVSFSIDDEIKLVWSDQRRLKQMIVNLLSNAVKFTPESGKLGLEVTANREGQQVLITVWDHGIGISEDNLTRLFQPFVQVDTGLSRESSGTGLGLALVAQMARLHGGHVLAKSILGQGSQFTIVLPWNPAEQTGSLVTFQTAQPESILPLQEIPAYTILLAEDAPNAVMFMEDYLIATGYNVVVARNGLEAISQAEIFKPDLILMDVMMPGLDGLEATKKIRSDPALHKIPILGLTALAMPGDRERCLEAGMNEHITKPVNLKKLLDTIKVYLPGE